MEDVFACTKVPISDSGEDVLMDDMMTAMRRDGERWPNQVGSTKTHAQDDDDERSCWACSVDFEQQMFSLFTRFSHATDAAS